MIIITTSTIRNAAKDFVTTLVKIMPKKYYTRYRFTSYMYR